MSGREEASAERRAAILTAALAVIAERGLHTTTINDIRQRSGASVGSIYHHFGDRAGLFYALYVESLGDCFAFLLENLKACDSAQAGIFALVKSYLDWVEANPQEAAFIYEASQGDLLRAYQEEIFAFKTNFYGKAFAWMLPFIQKGDLIKLPPWAYDAIVLGPAHEFARRWLGGLRELPMAEACDIIARAVWRAIQPETAVTRPT